MQSKSSNKIFRLGLLQYSLSKQPPVLARRGTVAHKYKTQHTHTKRNTRIQNTTHSNKTSRDSIETQ